MSKLLANSRIDSVIRDIINTSNTIAQTLESNIIKQDDQRVTDLLFEYIISSPQNINIQKSQVSNVVINTVVANLRNIIQDTIKVLITKMLIAPVYTLILFIFEMLFFALQNYAHVAILTSLIFLNSRDWSIITDVIKSFNQKGKNNLINLKILFEKYGINYAIIVHEYSVVWMYGILSILEFDRVYDESDEKYKMPAPGEWAKITEENIKYIVKYLGKIMKIPIITYNDEKQRVVYFLPLMKHAIKTSLDSIKKFIGVEVE